MCIRDRPEAALRQLDAYRGRLERRLGVFEQMERELPADEPIYGRVALAHGLAQVRATLAWVEDARPQLERDVRRRPQGGATRR